MRDIINTIIRRCFLAFLAPLGLGILGFSNSAKSNLIVPVIDVATGQLYGSVSGNDWLSPADTKEFVKDSMVLNAYARDGKILQKTILSTAPISEICANPTLRSKVPLPSNAVTLVGSQRMQLYANPKN